MLHPKRILMFLSARQINEELINRLSSIYEKGEVEAILHELRRKYPALNPLFGNDIPIGSELLLLLDDVVHRLEKQEPLFYILGAAPFMNMEIGVSRAVLIPRPETEELVRWALEEDNQPGKKVLDICSGSGCIAFGLRKYGRWNSVGGLEFSLAALNQAQKNARELGLEVSWINADVLANPELGMWDVWVSNPPYVCVMEQYHMEDGVLKFEPHEALFVPDNDPLIFYRHIIALSEKFLNPGGLLLFEVNPAYAEQVLEVIEAQNFINQEIRKDIFGKKRMVGGRKP